MKAVTAVVIMLLVVLCVGCQRGSFAVTPVIEGQVAPHAGYNIGPEIWVEPGDKVKLTGAVIWVEGLELYKSGTE